jgi:hypothetical protein
VVQEAEPLYNLLRPLLIPDIREIRISNPVQIPKESLAGPYMLLAGWDFTGYACLAIFDNLLLVAH